MYVILTTELSGVILMLSPFSEALKSQSKIKLISAKVANTAIVISFSEALKSQSKIKLISA
ncbi:MAG: hypothetical protein F6K48_18295 [Okeania sp. SIO3H1]|uniref:hypothetical protein n=1 Tax=Okeania sp. SIO1I7 TaxID=2607772 RepID=UPI0013C66271|nr:hypothetical protein [Okeania sp. SIO1I7]NEN90754.1 hypothetical protein [Okeania sp. SIO3H1]NET27228.1 hypothetical protein [Okeania sp. SIO1I7]